MVSPRNGVGGWSGKEGAFCCDETSTWSFVLYREALDIVEILWERAIDRGAAESILLKGFEDGRDLP